MGQKTKGAFVLFCMEHQRDNSKSQMDSSLRKATAGGFWNRPLTAFSFLSFFKKAYLNLWTYLCGKKEEKLHKPGICLVFSITCQLIHDLKNVNFNLFPFC